VHPFYALRARCGYGMQNSPKRQVVREEFSLSFERRPCRTFHNFRKTKFARAMQNFDQCACNLRSFRKLRKTRNINDGSMVVYARGEDHTWDRIHDVAFVR
jgi:hypothetical protein